VDGPGSCGATCGRPISKATGYAIDVRDCQVKGARFSAAEALSLLDPFRVRID
jgi:hypothetical protein